MSQAALEWGIYLLVGVLLALFSPYTFARGRKWWGYVLSAYFLFGWFVLVFNGWASSTWVWSNILDIQFHFLFHGIHRFFVFLVLLVASFIFFFATVYMGDSKRAGQFFLWYMLFTVAMLGLVTSDDLLMLFIFWELTSLFSFMLIGYQHEEEGARKAALQALLVTGFGGLLLLLGVLGFSLETQVSRISDFGMIDGEQINKKISWWVLLCFLAGGMTKSAQFPFHFWLPNAMKAPAPVSALLHSATMVKAGVFLFLLLDPLFDQVMAWKFGLQLFGGVTFLLGAWGTVRSVENKKMLAYSTVSTLGLLTFLVGVTGDGVPRLASLMVLLAHAFYKGGLFMVAGIKEKLFQSKKLWELPRIYRSYPSLGISAMLLSLSMLGIFPTIGFVAKEQLLLVFSDHLALLVVIGLGLVLLGLVPFSMGFFPWWGSKSESLSLSNKTFEEKNNLLFLLNIGPLGLGVLSVLLSFNPLNVLDGLFPAPWQLWGGVHQEFWISLAIIFLSFGLYKLIRFDIPFFVLNRLIHNLHHRVSNPLSDRIFRSFLDQMVRMAYQVTRLIQNGNLNQYLVVCFVTLVGIGFFSLVINSDLVKHVMVLPFHGFALDKFVAELILLATMAGAGVLACISHHRLSAIAAMGAIGYSIAGLFVLLGAPDLALTQIIVETLSVILFVYLLHRVPLIKPNHHKRSDVVGRLALSIGVGVLSMIGVLIALKVEGDTSLMKFYGENSLAIANGSNIVNVILVDFRGFDTMGEITVLTIGALVVGVLIQLGKKGRVT
ncbi:MAG: DUF4040 domain-containing protein [Bdellovibrionaceae bacterium]|nr:DUF4040 domain-containing protein [Pseudobdellovibrionaceae bacterium]MDW8189903.1 proton-conducting transporter membrane subunit [Pseudobdellovibrionaceae bacterium]